MHEWKGSVRCREIGRSWQSQDSYAIKSRLLELIQFMGECHQELSHLSHPGTTIHF